MINIAICEDSYSDYEIISNKIKRYLEERAIGYKIEHFTTSTLLLNTAFEYDILFLDIKLGGNLNGIEVGKILRQKDNKCILILVTSAPDYSIDGYQTEAIRFFVKPVSNEQINDVMNVSVAKLKTNKTKISVKLIENGNHSISIRNIVLIESYQRKRIILMNDKTQCLTRDTLPHIFANLPPEQFAYAQIGFIVNLDYISHISKNKIYLNDGKVVNLSRNFKVKFMSAFNEYIKNY